MPRIDSVEPHDGGRRANFIAASLPSLHWEQVETLAYDQEASWLFTGPVTRETGTMRSGR